MSPEQLKEFQKQQCIFCHIVSGKVQSRKIFEDDKALAILDINPANPGHILLFPKEHYPIMPVIPDDILGHLFIAAKNLSQNCLKVFKSQGTTIFVANGMAAGQKAQHFMIHIIPRMENDPLQNLNLVEKTLPAATQKKLFNKLKKRVDQMLGLAPAEEGAAEEDQGEEAAPEKPSKKKRKVVETAFQESKPMPGAKADLDTIADLLSGKR